MNACISFDRLSYSLFYVLLCGLGCLVYTLLPKNQSTPIPRVGKAPSPFGLKLFAKKEFFTDGKRLLDEGYAKFKQSMFMVQPLDVPRIVISTKYLEELRALPESILSHRESVSDRFLGYWSGLDVVRKSPLHNEICQTTLVQSLPMVLDSLHDEATTAIGEYIGEIPPAEQVELSPYGIVFSIISRVNSRVLVGLPLCRDKEWLLVSEGYPQDSVMVATILRQVPWILRPLLYPFLGATARLRQEYSIAEKKLGPLIGKRRASNEKDKPRDVLQWMIDQSSGDDSKTDNIIGKMMFVAMASFHASTTAAIHVLYDLCAHPEYLEPLREELGTELAAEGGQWTVGVLTRLKRLDSILKESQRMNAPGLLSFTRKLMQPLTLSDGTRLPRGAILNVPVHQVTHDPSVWADPERFDGFRFSNLRHSNASRDAEFQFAALNANSLGFGYGRFACPGRVFAAAQLKLTLGLLIMDYDFSFAEGEQAKRPENVYVADMVLPDRGVKLICHKR